MENLHKSRRALTGRDKKIISIAAPCVFLLFSAAVFWFVGRPMIAYIAEPARFRAWVDAHGLLGRLTYVGMMALQVVCALIPGEPLELGAGYAFGFWEGSLLCLAGAVAGSVLVFLLVRSFGVRLVEAFFPIEKIHRMKFLRDSRRLTLATFLLFFIPGTPKDLMCYVVGLTPMKLTTWLLISATARIPSIITSTLAGDALGARDYRFAAVAIAVTLVLSLTGLLVFNHFSKRGKPKS